MANEPHGCVHIFLKRISTSLAKWWDPSSRLFTADGCGVGSDSDGRLLLLPVEEGQTVLESRMPVGGQVGRAVSRARYART